MTATGAGIVEDSAEVATGAEAIESRMPNAVTARPMGRAGPRIGERGAAC
jgi:hypothetical protein